MEFGGGGGGGGGREGEMRERGFINKNIDNTSRRV